MSRVRAAVIFFLRIIGVLALVFFLFMGINYFTSPHGSIEGMDIVFAGTEEEADCTLLMNRGYTVMIDTGEAQDFDNIQRLLRAYRISRIDCLILTHPDKDHIGSALSILKNYEVGLVVEPYYDQPNERYEEINDYIEAEALKCLVLSRERSLVYGDMNLRIYPPQEFSYDKDNSYSLVTSVQHGNNRLFFAGDAMRKRTEEIMSLPVENVNLYKMSYHGRYYKGGIELLEKLNPDIVVITSRESDDKYEQFLERRKVYYTVRNDVCFYSDGRSILLK